MCLVLLQSQQYLELMDMWKPSLIQDATEALQFIEITKVLVGKWIELSSCVMMLSMV